MTLEGFYFRQVYNFFWPFSYITPPFQFCSFHQLGNKSDVEVFSQRPESEWHFNSVPSHSCSFFYTNLDREAKLLLSARWLVAPTSPDWAFELTREVGRWLKAKRLAFVNTYGQLPQIATETMMMICVINWFNRKAILYSRTCGCDGPCGWSCHLLLPSGRNAR